MLAMYQAQYEAFCEEELDRLQEKCQRQLQMIGSGHFNAKTQTTVCNNYGNCAVSLMYYILE